MATVELAERRSLRNLRVDHAREISQAIINVGIVNQFPGEDRILVPRPTGRNYDLESEMSAPQITEYMLEAITSGKYEAIICNFANSGLVGHSGIITATIRAVEAVDRVLQGVVEALKSVGRRILLNADRSDIKRMVDKETEQPLTAHTKNPVSWVYVCGDKTWTPGGGLSDLATTVRAIFGIELLPEMSGRTLFYAA